MCPLPAVSSACLRAGTHRQAQAGHTAGAESGAGGPPPATADALLVTFGVNDAVCAWMRIPEEDLMKRLVEV